MEIDTALKILREKALINQKEIELTSKETTAFYLLVGYADRQRDMWLNKERRGEIKHQNLEKKIKILRAKIRRLNGQRYKKSSSN